MKCTAENTQGQRSATTWLRLRHKGSAIGLPLLAFTLLAAGLLQTTAGGDGLPIADRGDQFILGMGTHLSGGSRPIGLSVSMLAEAGVTASRDDIYWTWVEKQRGVMEVPASSDAYVQAALNEGISPMIVLGYGNDIYGISKPDTDAQRQAYVRYASFVVQHFKGKVHRYELWNEWDWKSGNTQPGSVDDYLMLLRATYPVLKAIDPSAQFLVGAVSASGLRDGFLEMLVRNGGLQYSDGLSLHPYNHNDSDPRPEAWASWMRQLEGDLRSWSGRGEVPLYITEMGWPTYTGDGGVTDAVQAEYLSRLLLLARTMPFVKGLWWYDFQDDGIETCEMEYNFGVVDHALQPKPAYDALRELSSLITSATYTGELALAEPNLVAIQFEDPHGNMTWAVWSLVEGQSYQLQLAAQAPNDIEVSYLDGKREALAWAAPSGGGDAASYTGSLTISNTPVLLTGDLSQTLIAGVVATAQ